MRSMRAITILKLSIIFSLLKFYIIYIYYIYIKIKILFFWYF